MATSYLILNISMFYFLTIFVSKSFGASSRHLNAQSIPMNNAYLDATPIHQQLASEVKCLELCSMNEKCVSINYHVNKTCQLLQNYICEGVKSLANENGFRYYDVDYNQTPQDLDYYRTRSECTSLNKCSPKCKACTGSTFSAQEDGRITGLNINFFSSKTFLQCKTLCEADPRCHAIEHKTSVNFCFLSRVSKAMVHSDLYDPDPSYKFADRICS